MLSRGLLCIGMCWILLVLWLLTLQSDSCSDEQRNRLPATGFAGWICSLPYVRFQCYSMWKPSSFDTVFGCRLSVSPWCSPERHYSYSKHFYFSLPLVRYVRSKPWFSFCSCFLSSIVPSETLRVETLEVKLNDTRFFRRSSFSVLQGKGTGAVVLLLLLFLLFFFLLEFCSEFNFCARNHPALLLGSSTISRQY